MDARTCFLRVPYCKDLTCSIGNIREKLNVESLWLKQHYAWFWSMRKLKERMKHRYILSQMENMLLVRLLLPLMLISPSAEVVLIWQTNGVHSDQFDCVHYSNDTEHAESIPFCRRPSFVETDDGRAPYQACQNKRSYHSFAELAMNKTQPEHLLTWNSAIDVLDAYATFLHFSSGWGSASMTNQTQHLDTVGICNCSSNGSSYFGRWCEYELLSSVSFPEAVDHQFALKEQNEIGSQWFGNLTCYISLLECDPGPVCLDWRQICDGRIVRRRVGQTEALILLQGSNSVWMVETKSTVNNSSMQRAMNHCKSIVVKRASASIRSSYLMGTLIVMIFPVRKIVLWRWHIVWFRWAEELYQFPALRLLLSTEFWLWWTSPYHQRILFMWWR